MPHTVVIFGASGDLTSRKLIPALYRCIARSGCPTETRIVGVSRTTFTRRRVAAEARRDDGEVRRQGVRRRKLGQSSPPTIFYQPGDIGQRERLSRRWPSCSTSSKAGAGATRVYYLATAPQFYEPAIAQSRRGGPGRRRRAACGGSSSKSRSASICNRPSS